MQTEFLQLELWEPEIKAREFFNEKGKPLYPFATGQGWADWEICHAARFAYWESEKSMIVFSPMPLWVSFWKDDKTPEGELKTSINGTPEREKSIWRKRLADWAAEWQDVEIPEEFKPRKPRKRYKWSKAAIIQNRQRRLRKRIEKKHGYDPEQPSLFQEELLADIENEFTETIYTQPEYFIEGKSYNRFTEKFTDK